MSLSLERAFTSVYPQIGARFVYAKSTRRHVFTSYRNDHDSITPFTRSKNYLYRDLDCNLDCDLGPVLLRILRQIVNVAQCKVH